MVLRVSRHYVDCCSDIHSDREGSMGKKSSCFAVLYIYPMPNINKLSKLLWMLGIDAACQVSETPQEIQRL